MSIQERTEILWIWGIAIASLAIAALDFFDLLGPLEGRIPSITLALVGLVAGYLAIERRSKLQNIETTIVHRTGEIDTRLSRWESDLSGIDAFFSSIASSDPFATLRLIYGLRGFKSTVSGNEIRADRENVFQLWADSLDLANSFLAFNYVSSDEVWGTGWSFNVAQALQAARIAEGATIRRIFVIDSREELAKLEKLMSQQGSIGIDVRWILRETVEENPIVQDYLDRLQARDIVVLDDEYVFRVFLDGQRHMTGCSLIKDPNLASIARHIFNDAAQRATRQLANRS